MRFAATVLSAICVSSALPSAQQQSPPVFRGGVDLVTLDVTVVDKAGLPIKGLKPEDFVVTLDGQARPVRALDFLEFGASSRAAAQLSRQTANQSAGGATRGGRVFLIVFDDLSTNLLQAKGLTVAAERMLSTLDLDDFVGLVTTSGLGPVVQPTRDRTAVLTALRSRELIGRDDDNPSPRYYIGIHEALDIFRGVTSTLVKVVARDCGILNYNPANPTASKGDSICPHLVEADGRHLGELTVHRTAMQMAAYRSAIAALRSSPKPRVMIALTSGVATSPEFNLQEQTDAISRAAAEAGVQFYALTNSDDEVDFSRMGSQLDRREESRFLNGGAQVLATAAGGEAFLVVGTADRFFSRIERETSGFYQLGVEAPLAAPKTRILNAKVTVRLSGATVRTNLHAVAENVAPDPISIDEHLKTVLAQGGVSFGVPIALATALRRSTDPTAALEVGVDVQVPSIIQAPLVAMFAVVDDTGRTVQEGRKRLSSGTLNEDYELTFGVPVASGKYRLRFAIADAAGNVGSVEHEIDATLRQFGRCRVSDLMTAWAIAGGSPRFLALETLPAGATTLRTSLELYPDDTVGGSDLSVRLALVPLGGAGPTIERDVTPAGSGTTRTITASLPANQLPSGSYMIRATIFDRGVAVGTLSTTIRRKAPSQADDYDRRP